MMDVKADRRSAVDGARGTREDAANCAEEGLVLEANAAGSGQTAAEVSVTRWLVCGHKEGVASAL